MKRSEIKDIVERWMFPTEKSSYMGGIEDAPVIAESHGSTVVDTDGKEYLDFHSGLHGSTSFLTRSLTFAWQRRKHALVAPATSSILAPYCYRCPIGLTFPKCEIQCLKTSMLLADANF